jgi:D-3-phosphoglycerate dehydrogenase
MGRVGKQVAEIVRGFGGDVVADQPADVDIVSIHLRLTDLTRGCVCRRELERWNPGTILVNTARPDLVVPTDIAWALDTGRLGWYAADFLNGIVHPHMTLTPHVAGWTVEGVDITQEYLAERVAACLDSET